MIKYYQEVTRKAESVVQHIHLFSSLFLAWYCKDNIQKVQNVFWLIFQKFLTSYKREVGGVLCVRVWGGGARGRCLFLPVITILNYI